MIAVDPSALVAIVREALGHADYSTLMAEAGAALGAPSYLEAHLVLSRVSAPVVEAFFDRLKRNGQVTVVDFTPGMADAAVDAFRRYGKGRGHPARLNFGDCLSYGVAKTLGLPLLYYGSDFAHTDIEPALRP